MNNNKNISRNVLLLLTTLSVSGFAAAQNDTDNLTPIAGQSIAGQNLPQHSFLPDLVSRADLVFRGQVIEKYERLSIEQIPYTFVTYKVSEVIGGKYNNDTITVKFVGGQFANGNRLTASNSPVIELGEEAVMMIQQSKDSGCDFVDCEKGRFVLKKPFKSANLVISVLSMRLIMSPLFIPAFSAPDSF